MKRCPGYSGWHYFQKDSRPNVWQCTECGYSVLVNTVPADMGDCFAWLARDSGHNINHVHLRKTGESLRGVSTPWIKSAYAIGCCNADFDCRGKHVPMSDDPHAIVLTSLN